MCSIALDGEDQQPNDHPSIAIIQHDAQLEDDASSARSPMWVMRLDDVLALQPGDLRPHKELKELNLIREYEPSLGRALFVSHQWTSLGHPDPEFSQFRVLQGALRLLVAGEIDVSDHFGQAIGGTNRVVPGERWKAMFRGETNVFVWYDFFSVPQPNINTSTPAAELADMRAAIDSIPMFIAQAEFFVVLAPSVVHQDTRVPCTYETWMSRGWCRLEALALSFGPRGADAPSLLIENSTSVCFRPTYDCLTRAVGLGEFAVPADREVLAGVVWNLLQARCAQCLAQNNLPNYRWMRAMRAHFLRGLPVARIRIGHDGRSLPEQDTGPSVSGLDALRDGERSWAEFATAYHLSEWTSLGAPGWPPLRYAAISGNAGVVRELIALRADVHQTTTNRMDMRGGSYGGESILASAAQVCGGHFEARTILRELLEANADPHGRSRASGFSPLVEACRFNNVEAVDALLALVPALLEPRHFSTTRGVGLDPVTACALTGHVGPLRSLSDAGAPHDGLDWFGLGALHLACVFGSEAVLRLLLSAPDVQRRINEAHRPRSVLSTLIRANAWLQRALGSNHSAQIMLTESVGGSPLHCAIVSGQLSAARMLLDAGADPNVVSHAGRTCAELVLHMGTLRADFPSSPFVEMLERAHAPDQQ